MNKIELVEKILSAISIPASLGEDTEEDFCEDLYDFQDKIKDAGMGHVEVACGDTKGVIIPPSADYVIKIPFDCIYTLDESSYEEEEYEMIPELFEEADDLDMGGNHSAWDYCLNEMRKYENAVSAGFAEFFAKTSYYCEKDNRGIYLQEKVVTFWDVESDWDNKERASAEARTIAKSQEFKDAAKRRYLPFDSEWIADCIDWWGEERTLEFLNYVRDAGLDRDCHSHNYGYRVGDNSPVFFDISGYRG